MLQKVGVLLDGIHSHSQRVETLKNKLSSWRMVKRTRSANFSLPITRWTSSSRSFQNLLFASWMGWFVGVALGLQCMVHLELPLKSMSSTESYVITILDHVAWAFARFVVFIHYLRSMLSNVVQCFEQYEMGYAWGEDWLLSRQWSFLFFQQISNRSRNRFDICIKGCCLLWSGIVWFTIFYSQHEFSIACLSYVDELLTTSHFLCVCMFSTASQRCGCSNALYKVKETDGCRKKFRTNEA